MNRRQFLITSQAVLAAGLLPVSAAEEVEKTVWGIPELWQWLYQTQHTSGHDAADCLQAHLKQGVRHVLWSLGRSTLDYHSALETSTLYAGDTRPETSVIAASFARECSLRAALTFAASHGMVIYGRLGMNRHYGDALGGGLRSKYIAAHPEWLEQFRNGKVDASKVSFAVPEYRAERISILLEVAQIGAHGLCLDFCRQPPVARYHPRLLEPWLKVGRGDPRGLVVGSPEFLEWARHRCGFINLFLRDLRQQLRELERQTNRKIPVQVRVPEATPEVNLLEGLDLQTWLQEGWVDEIALNPLWIWDFDYPDTASPYIAMARAHRVKIYGGANAVTGKGVKANARGFLERVARNYEEGVDGMALFQTDAAFLVPELSHLFKSLFPHLRDVAAVSERLAVARKEQPQLGESERHFGLDNHSLLPQLGRASRISLDTI